MKNFLSLLSVVLFIVGLAIGTRLFYDSKQNPTVEPQRSSTTDLVSVSSGENGASQILSGEELARKHCVECHVFTEPEILNKKSWNFLLTYMGLRLGIDDDSYLQNPTAQEKEVIDSRRYLLTEEKLIPAEAAMTDAEWRRLREYYQKHAPDKTLPQLNKPKSAGSIDGVFASKRHLYKLPYAVTSMVRIDEQKQQLLIGDSVGQKLTILDSDLFQVDSISSKRNFWVDAISGNKDIYLLSVGDIPGSFPGQRLGKIAYGKRLGDIFIPGAAVLENLYRPTDMEFADLNNDGVEELVLCSFGDEGGDFSIYRRAEDGLNFDPNPITTLFKNTGSIKCASHDFNDDGLLDIVLMVSDVEEHLSLFINKGDFKFSERLITSVHPSWGYMSFQLADVNQDGHMDIVTANGDNGDSDPYNTLKNYHGVRVYLNHNKTQFKEAYFYPMYGCYDVKVYDFDLDGDIDIAATAFHPDFNEAEPEHFVFLEQTSSMHFEPKHHPATQQGRWMCMDAGDLDQDGDVDIVLGAAYVPIGLPEKDSALYQKYMQGDTLLFLENLTVK